MNKKGFTLVELLGVIVLLAIVSGLAVLSMSSVINVGKKSVYKNYEDTMKESTINYLTDEPKEIPDIGSEKKIYIDDLIARQYMDNIDDPNGGDCNNENLNSYVLVTRGEDITFNYHLEYKVCLMCIINNDEFTYRSSDDC